MNSNEQKIQELQAQAREWQRVLYRGAQMRHGRSTGNAHRELEKIWKQIDKLRAEG